MSLSMYVATWNCLDETDFQRDVEHETYLQQLLKLVDDVSRCSFLLTPSHIGRCFDDVTQLVRQVIFTAHRPAIDSDTRTDRRGRYWKDRENHPLWPRIVGRQPKKVEVRIRNLLQCSVHFMRREQPLVRLERLRLLCEMSNANTIDMREQTSSSSFPRLYCTKSLRPSFLI